MPDPFRARYRDHLAEAIRQVVLENARAMDASAALSLPTQDQQAFLTLLIRELQGLAPYNCARYRLSIRKTEDWLARGRPFAPQKWSIHG